MASRYSIIPADFVDDARPTLVHYRVIVSLGRRTNRSGWCVISQTKLAGKLGFHRQAVCTAIKELVAWGYVEKKGQADTKRALCFYRVLMDRTVPLADVPDGVEDGDSAAEDEHGESGDDAADVSATADTPLSAIPDTHVSATADTRVRPRQTRGVCPRQTPITTPRERPPSHNDRTARAPRTGEGEIENLLQQVRTPDRARLLDRCLRPILSGLKFDAPSKLAALIQLADDPALRGLDDLGLDNVVRMVTTKRVDSVRASDIKRFIADEAPRAAMRHAQRAKQEREAERSPEALTIWTRIREEIRRSVPDEAFDAWIAPLELISVDGDQITVAAPMKVIRSTVQRDYGGLLEREAIEALGADARVRVTLLQPLREAA